MSARSFFQGSRGITVAEIATLTGAELRRSADPALTIAGVAALDRGGPSDLVFLDHPKFTAQARASAAGACLTTQRLAEHVPTGMALLVADSRSTPSSRPPRAVSRRAAPVFLVSGAMARPVLRRERSSIRARASKTV
jgi:UDP-3-O-[3-hydroxymyristoyl] glucosamine N-acyltransferase